MFDFPSLKYSLASDLLVRHMEMLSLWRLLWWLFRTFLYFSVSKVCRGCRRRRIKCEENNGHFCEHFHAYYDAGTPPPPHHPDTDTTQANTMKSMMHMVLLTLACFAAKTTAQSFKTRTPGTSSTKCSYWTSEFMCSGEREYNTTVLCTWDSDAFRCVGLAQGSTDTSEPVQWPDQFQPTTPDTVPDAVLLVCSGWTDEFTCVTQITTCVWENNLCTAPGQSEPAGTPKSPTSGTAFSQCSSWQDEHSCESELQFASTEKCVWDKDDKKCEDEGDVASGLATIFVIMIVVSILICCIFWGCIIFCCCMGGAAVMKKAQSTNMTSVMNEQHEQHDYNQYDNNHNNMTNTNTDDYKL